MDKRGPARKSAEKEEQANGYRFGFRRRRHCGRIAFAEPLTTMDILVSFMHVVDVCSNDDDDDDDD